MGTVWVIWSYTRIGKHLLGNNKLWGSYAGVYRHGWSSSYVDVEIWLVPVTLESIKESTGSLCGVIKHQLTLEPLSFTTWLVVRSEMANFGVFPRSTDTRCYTHWGLTLKFCLVASQSPIKRSLGERSVILRSLRTRLLFIGQVEPIWTSRGYYLKPM